MAWFRWRAVLVAAAVLAIVGPSAVLAQTQVRPRFMIAFDTSGSMAVDLNNIPTFGDGVPGATEGLDTDCDGNADDSRIFVAKEALRNMVLAFGDIEFGLSRFPQFGQADVACNWDRPGSANTHQINNQECNIAAGPFVGGIGDPTLNTGAAINNGNCGGEWDGTPGTETPFAVYPAACRPSGPRMWATGSPQFCTNYLGNCPGDAGFYTFPDGDILVGFEGFGWPSAVDNRGGLLRWIDNRETSFDAGTTNGDWCDHSGGGDCELRPQGPTPLGGVLRASSDYITPIRAGDSVGSCRPYTVLLLTDGTEVCSPDPSSADHPVNVADELFRLNGIPVYVVGLSIGFGGRAGLNAIATAGGTDAGGAGGDTAFFADDPVTLAAGLSQIVADSLLVELCNDLDDDCDTLIDEGFVKFCNRPAGVTTESLCGDPGETVCDGFDDNCNGLVDEGLLNACGTCGPEPIEVCDSVDNDCDGAIDEGGVCAMCRPEPEICDGVDNDCDTLIDEDLTRACGVDLGECSAGTQVCTAGSFGPCSDTGPTVEICDGLDNDCDGLPDNVTRPCGSDVGECVSGIERCTAGAFGTCMGSVGPSAEECNGLDDDCDGTVDEGVAGLGAACGTSEGECTPGMLACVGGAVVCDGGTGPVEEVCNGLDDDCDGIADDGIFVGTPCGTDTGECSPGVNFCRMGGVVCEGATDASPEACDGLDNDCDGEVDEGLGIGEPCGEAEGLCMEGALQCVDGRETCVGEVPPVREGCDCEDNDCDGAIDEDPDLGPLCPTGSRCVECQCALPCAETEFGFGCPTGRAPRVTGEECFCVAEACDRVACGETSVERDGATLCEPDSGDVAGCVCKNNECTFSCDGVVCPEGTVCDPRDPVGRCAEDSCRGLGCPEGELCDVVSGECEVDPCTTTTCGVDEACRVGGCEPSCATTTCADGERCAAGACLVDRCADVTCPATETCDPSDGSCQPDLCGGVRCPTGSLCDPLTGDCELDPCAILHCPDGQACVEGECATMRVPDAGPPPMDAGPPADRVLATGSGGCVCAVAPGASSGRSAPATALVFGLFGMLWFRRRRGAGRWLALLVGGGALLLVSGCDVEPFCLNCEDGDASTDGAIADGGVDADGAPRDSAPREDSAVEDAGPDGCMEGAPERCNALDDDCDGLVDEGVDTDSDPNNCGGCGVVCAPPGAFGTCEVGVCGLGPCDVGFIDLDGLEDNGCEYRCLPTGVDDAVCDLRDNDCDGEVDEDVVMATDIANCGACGRTCRFARSTAECVGGTCGIDECDADFYDIDGVEGNGCEYACVLADPAVETCNARDDDCDGMVDEGNPDGGGDCGSAVGACSLGSEVCLGGFLQCMGDTGPTPESCNTVDDDCDSSIDEETNFDDDPNNCGSCGTSCARTDAVTRCTSGTCTLLVCESGFIDFDGDLDNGCEFMCEARGAEVCNGEDDDCDTLADEPSDLTAPAMFCNPNGVCAGTSATCGGASGWTCEYTDARFEASEVSCDGVDNDCDGRVDEAHALVGFPCMNGLGECARSGIYRCSADGLAVECDAGTAGMGVTESCNGLDDDCDGATDEDIPASAMPTVQMPLSGGGTVEVFAYEASRPDATSGDAGALSTAACSRANTLPWTTVTWPEARDACCALNTAGACPGAGTAGWRLCDAAQWQQACEGPTGTCDWSYSASCSSSQPTRCNGTEYDCDGATPGAQDCLFPTGSATFSGCSTNWGAAGSVRDLSGNVKEWVGDTVAPGIHPIRGGAYNNLEDGRQCGFDFTVGDEAFAFPNTGFRCCFYAP